MVDLPTVHPEYSLTYYRYLNEDRSYLKNSPTQNFVLSKPIMRSSRVSGKGC